MKRLLVAGYSFTILMIVNPSSALSESTNAHLLDKAASKGSVRVIVRLNMDYKTEGRLSSANSVEKQRSVIARKQQRLLGRLAGKKISGAKYFKTIPYIAMKVDADGLKALLDDYDVLSIEEDITFPSTINESVPFIKADMTYDSGYDGTGWTVAVLDTGVRNTHEFLACKVVSEACYSTAEANNSTSLCPGGVNSTATGSGVNCNITGCDHGTHVAGIIAGKKEEEIDGKTVVKRKGVAPGAKIIAIQVFSRFDTADQCDSDTIPCISSYTSDLILGLERVYALRNDYKIAPVNMSLGGGKYSSACDTDSIKYAIDNLRSAGIATVIASGNEYYDGYVSKPGCISSAVTVGATVDDAVTVADYSNHADMVDLMAPGSSITSSTAVSDTSYGTKNGTSMAAPHVAGAFAVMKSENADWTVDDIETRLKNTGIPVTRAGVTKPLISLAVPTFPIVLAGKFYLLPVRKNNTPTVTSLATCRTWMDRNLGASWVATSMTDAEAYGYLYQWGRGKDGHEKRTSGITTTLSSTDDPGHGKFITTSSEPYDWRISQNDNLWQGVSGINKPCPSGFRIPTADEWQEEMDSWSSKDAAGAFASSLKLVAPGQRIYLNGTIFEPNLRGTYWSSTTNSGSSQYMLVQSGSAALCSNSRAYGMSVRCIKDVSLTSLNEGLVAHYEFEDNANDSSGNENNGVEYGGVSYIDGVIGKSLYLSEADDYIGVEKDISLQDFSLSFFVNIDKKAPVVNMLVNGANSSNDNEFNFSWFPDERIEVLLSKKQVFSGSYDMLSKWTHIVYVNQGSTVKLYINGELFNNYDMSGVDLNENIEYLVIGKDQDCMRGCFEETQGLFGKIDDLRIYNRPITESEIAELYNMGQ